MAPENGTEQTIVIIDHTYRNPNTVSVRSTELIARRELIDNINVAATKAALATKDMINSIHDDMVKRDQNRNKSMGLKRKKGRR